MNTLIKIKSGLRENASGILILTIGCIAVVTVAFIVYSYTQRLLHERLRERLIAITSTAALMFNASEIEALQRQGSEVVYDEQYDEVLVKLQKIKQSNKDIAYAYIFGKTSDPNTLVFIADADVAIKDQALSEEGDFPGSSYDVSEVPVLNSGLAFETATADDEIIPDEWGDILAGYAPILNENGEANAIIGIDVVVTDYLKIVRATMLPFTLFAIFLLLLLTLVVLILVRIWKSRVEIVKELDKQKDELLSIVSHQLATPVSSTKWYIEMMLDGDLGKVSKEQKNHLETMKNIAAGLSDLVGMILDVSRIQLGRMKIEKQELDLEKFFQEILNVIRPKAEQKNQTLNVEIPKKLPKAILDKRYTLMTIENLLSNAVKYSPEGGEVNFMVRIEGNNLHCEVADNGCGIPKNDQDKIFGKLFRASNVRNEVDGNGFGLFVAKGAVESQGGKIWFQSIEKEGTTFFVDLPLR